MNSKFKVEISLDEESKKLLKKVLKHLKQLKQLKEVQHLKGGKYQTCKVVGKYGKDIELPDEYEVLIIKTQKESN